MTDVHMALLASAGDGTRDARFDEATHTWTLGNRRARVIISSDGTLPARSVPADREGPYLGIAVPGIPNYFLLTASEVAAQKAYIAKCLDYLSRTESTRIEVRSRARRDFAGHSILSILWARHRSHNWRRAAKRIPSAFEFSSLGDDHEADDAVHGGTAIVRIGSQSYRTRVRLTGHIDPVDGHYHWQGTLFDINVDVKLPRDVTVVVQDRTAAARLTERTPWSTYSVVGVGMPPFALSRVEVEVPIL